MERTRISLIKHQRVIRCVQTETEQIQFILITKEKILAFNYLLSSIQTGIWHKYLFYLKPVQLKPKQILMTCTYSIYTPDLALIV